MSKVKREFNEVNFKGVVDDRATSQEFNNKQKSVVLIRQSYQFRDKFLTTVVPVACWGSDLNHLQKGDTVFVRGRLASREYTDKQTGQTKYFIEMVADDVMKLYEVDTPVKTSSPAATSIFGGEEIPF